MKSITFYDLKGNEIAPPTRFVDLIKEDKQADFLNQVSTAQPPPAPSTSDFYERFDTRTLESVLLGLERDFDTVSTNPAEAQFLCPADRLSRQMSTIRQILNQREEERASEPVHLRDAHAEVKQGRAKSVTRWDRKRGGRA